MRDYLLAVAAMDASSQLIFLLMFHVAVPVPEHNRVSKKGNLASQTQAMERRPLQGCQLWLVPFCRFDERTPSTLSGQFAKDIADQ